MADTRTIIVRGGGGGSAGILLLLIAAAGLLALFSGNLDRIIGAIAGGAGGAEGIGGADLDRSPQPAPSQPPLRDPGPTEPPRAPGGHQERA